MKAGRGIHGVSDRALTWLVRILAGLVVVGILGFGAFYYLDRRVPDQPSLIDREVASAEAGVRKDPANVDARLKLAAMYQAAKRYDDAVDQYDEILRVVKDHRAAILGKGQVLIEMKKYDDAIKTLHRITDADATGEFAAADPQLQAAFYFLGVIAVKQDDPGEALKQLDAALKIEPTDADALYQVGLAQMQLGKDEVAIKDFQKALAFVPTGWAEPYDQMAKAYTKLGKDAEATYAQGMAAFGRSDYPAANDLLTSQTDGPVGVEAMLGLALMTEVRGDHDGALDWYRKVLDKDPKNATAKAALDQGDGQSSEQG